MKCRPTPRGPAKVRRAVTNEIRKNFRHDCTVPANRVTDTHLGPITLSLAQLPDAYSTGAILRVNGRTTNRKYAKSYGANRDDRTRGFSSHADNEHVRY